MVQAPKDVWHIDGLGMLSVAGTIIIKNTSLTHTSDRVDLKCIVGI